MSHEFQERYLTSDDGLRLHYRDYNAQAPDPTADRAPVIFLTGLTRNARDYEDIAPRLAQNRRVLCPDPKGRGLSDNDPNPDNYHPSTHVRDTVRLLDEAGIEKVICIGTSMGGIMSMMMAASVPERLAGIVLNDVGPVVDADGVARIAQYVGLLEPMPDWAAAVAQYKDFNSSQYANVDDDEWARLTRRHYSEREDGKIAPDYDPGIGNNLRKGTAVPADLWPIYDAASQFPLMVLRGELTDILTPETVAAMKQRNPDLTVVTVPDRGHTPTMDEPMVVEALQRFLAQVDGETG
ncbi:MAG: alpha/beta hydrolase [Proteobacteria bacterium]|nr:alpha/beta hydrolase [Pseudomonadota bacterium]